MHGAIDERFHRGNVTAVLEASLKMVVSTTKAANRQVKKERCVATKDNIAAKQFGVLP